MFALILQAQIENSMKLDTRKRHVVSLEKMSAEVRDAFNAKYPGGIVDCEDDIQQYPKPSGEIFYAVTIELPEDIYLVKIPVEVDNIEDVQQWLDNDLEPESAAAAPDTEPEDTTLPDDNISQYSSGDASEEDE